MPGSCLVASTTSCNKAYSSSPPNSLSYSSALEHTHRIMLAARDSVRSQCGEIPTVPPQIRILYLTWLGTLFTATRPSYDTDANTHGSTELHATPAATPQQVTSQLVPHPRGAVKQSVGPGPASTLVIVRCRALMACGAATFIRWDHICGYPTHAALQGLPCRPSLTAAVPG